MIKIDPKNILTSEQIFKKNVQLAREKRNTLLKESDWTQLSDSPVDKKEWAEYRQSLRDLTENIIDPFDIKWPVKPE